MFVVNWKIEKIMEIFAIEIMRGKWGMRNIQAVMKS
jgi:hypothetical protein